MLNLGRHGDQIPSNRVKLLLRQHWLVWAEPFAKGYTQTSIALVRATKGTPTGEPGRPALGTDGLLVD